MATDATGAPTSLGIPKFNTSADAPSGLGSNAQMDSLDALIAARVLKPAGILSGEVPVWNGSTWVRSSATNIGPSSLGSGSPSSTTFLRGDGTWAVAGLKTTVSTLAGGPPGSPADTDIWVATAVDANGTRWVFQYNAGSASASKWEFIGGSPARVDIATDESTASTTYVDLTTAGPSFTLARAGDYDCVIHIETYNNTSGAGNLAAIKRGAAATSDNDSVTTVIQTTGSAYGGISRPIAITGAAASDVLKMQYRVGSGTGNFRKRALLVTPKRVA